MSLLSRLAVQAARAYGILSSADKTKVAASYLVVAGGGGGGGAYDTPSGGGGAGGYQASTFTLSTLNTYSVAVGAGGNGGAGANPGGLPGSNGSNSSISGTNLTTITSIGGGGGGAYYVSQQQGSNGGSGGGGSYGSSGGTGTSGQGNNGGSSTILGNQGAGGGGGASAVGSNGTSTTGGNGGAGTASSISGSSVTYAGGGGGSVYNGGTPGSGGSGGGGSGVLNGNGISGTTNLGGGGGGAGSTSGSLANRTGGSGGSGIVIISYASATPKFVGGTLTTSGGNQIHTFTSSGTLSPLTPVTASYLVVAGGGGGAQGGGGAGGLLTSSTTLYSGATYVVTVGAGGSGGPPTTTGSQTNGSDSILSGTGLTTITATGGGYGGRTGGGNGNTGGSGGGGAYATNGGAGTSGQGFAGGNGGGASSAGGGGGSSAVGSAGSGSTGGNGGAGTASSITGSSITYAGGGGGAANTTAGSGGTGGGGAGGVSTTNGGSGTTNLGGGGGGGGTTSSTGGNGGSGTVIISYAGSQVFNGGLVTSSGGNTIHTFTATGALTPLTNNLNNSLRFRGSASAYLSRTNVTNTNANTWTWSAWVKRGTISSASIQMLSGWTSSSTYNQGFGFASNDTFCIYNNVASATTPAAASSAVYRDPAAWYHVTVKSDGTNTIGYINGNQVVSYVGVIGSFQLAGAISVLSGQWSRTGSTNSLYFDGYMTDINFIDGQALEPYYFGNNDANGVWKPIQYKGTYGTNGFYLTFGNTTSTTTLGYDSSPNGNNWTCNNISLTAGTTYDAMLDVPTNTSATVANYPTLNPLIRPYSSTTDLITWGNLRASSTSGPSGSQGATMSFTSGKYYFEATATTVSGANVTWIGVCNNLTYYSLGTWTSAFVRDYGYTYASNGKSYTNATPSGTTYGATYTSGDIIGVAIDADAGTMTFYKNGTSQGTAFTGMSYTGGYVFGCTEDNSNVVDFNFGQRPFSYTPPSGYLPLNTYNLPTPTILQGNKYMDATLYTGTGVSNTVVNQGQFKPDLVWMKARNAAQWNLLFDSVRGVGKWLTSNNTTAEVTDATSLTAFNSNGFAVSTDPAVSADTGWNASGNTMVGWQWQAGQGSTSSNTSGSITSTVSVNTTAGFSIVTYTGNNTSGATVGHGLGVVPAMVICKNRSAGIGSGAWPVWHKSLTGGTYYLFLNTTAAQSNTNNNFTATPTSTVLNLGTSDTNNTATMVAYCFAEIAGFSKFGSYAGNSSTDGPFIYLGFRPKFVIFKDYSNAHSWVMVDSSRNTYNVAGDYLRAESSAVENATYSVANNTAVDFLSNGFKLRNAAVNSGENNGSSNYLYMAFAEHPFKNSNAR
jgi:hypothetical protein